MSQVSATRGRPQEGCELDPEIRRLQLRAREVDQWLNFGRARAALIAQLEYQHRLVSQRIAELAEAEPESARGLGL